MQIANILWRKKMKHFLIAASLAALLGTAQFSTPVTAQNNIAQMCRNKYGIDPKRVTTDGQRQEANKKVQACIKSGGKM
jgi:hypothetical protein